MEGAPDFSAIISAITKVISVEQILGVLTTVIAVAVAFVFFWWGARKVTRVVMSAFRRGRLSV